MSRSNLFAGGRWPGTVSHWPVFDDDERLLTEVVDEIMREKIDDPKGTNPGALTKADLKNEVARRIRAPGPHQLNTSWIVFSSEMKQVLGDATHHKVLEEVSDEEDPEFKGTEDEKNEAKRLKLHSNINAYSSSGAGWMQEWQRVQEIAKLQGTQVR